MRSQAIAIRFLRFGNENTACVSLIDVCLSQRFPAKMAFFPRSPLIKTENKVNGA